MVRTPAVVTSTTALTSRPAPVAVQEAVLGTSAEARTPRRSGHGWLVGGRWLSWDSGSPIGGTRWSRRVSLSPRSAIAAGMSGTTGKPPAAQASASAVWEDGRPALSCGQAVRSSNGGCASRSGSSRRGNRFRSPLLFGVRGSAGTSGHRMRCGSDGRRTCHQVLAFIDGYRLDYEHVNAVEPRCSKDSPGRIRSGLPPMTARLVAYPARPFSGDLDIGGLAGLDGGPRRPTARRRAARRKPRRCSAMRRTGQHGRGPWRHDPLTLKTGTLLTRTVALDDRGRRQGERLGCRRFRLYRRRRRTQGRPVESR